MKYIPIINWSRREKRVNENGYILVYVPEHPKSFRGGYYYEHRLVAEKFLNRILNSWETVHHISGNKCDNTWENLFVCTRREHNYAEKLTALAS